LKQAFFYILFVIFFLSIYSCDNSSNKGIPQGTFTQNELKDTVTIPPPFVDTFPEIKYRKFEFKSQVIKKRFLDSITKLSTIAQTILSTLNRKEWNFIVNSKLILVPEVFTENRLAYSIFPTYYKGARKLPKLIMVSARYQALACYEYGNLVKFAPVNSGKERTQTYPGRYALTFRQRTRLSSLDSTWIMHYYFNFHPEAGMALHQFTMPGYPASHSCLRMLESDAAWIYNWGEGYKKDTNGKIIRLSGTPLIIIDHYPFGSEYRPWMEITSNKSLKLELPPDPMAVDEPLIPIVQIPEESRGSLVNKHLYIIAEDSLRKLGIIRPGVQITPSVNFNKIRRIKKAQELKEKMLREEKLKEQLKLLEDGPNTQNTENEEPPN